MEFALILQEQIALYPLLTPQDLGKLAYQSEFGPEHLVTVTPDLVAYLLEEWKSVPPDTPLRGAEPIGNGLCRFHLDRIQDPELAAPLLSEAFAKAAKAHHGTMAGLIARLDQISAFNFPGWSEWRADYEAHGCPPVRHSQIFRNAYAPHYRVILAADAGRLTEQLSRI